MSNQFVEIKSAVFKKFDKENLFQMTCSDITERFQLALMLVIIVARNFIETGGASSPGQLPPGADLLPFGLGRYLPGWVAQAAGPFALVLGTEMLIDWVKHAYITKFNNARPHALYGRFLDVLARDVAARAHADPDLTRRLGLPLLPLASLFIRAAAQTWQMLLAAHFPPPLPATVAYTGRARPVLELAWWLVPSARTIATIVFCALLFAALLVAKLFLGMALQSYAFARCQNGSLGATPPPPQTVADSGKPKAPASSDSSEDMTVPGAKRIGAWGVVEVSADSKRYIAEADERGEPTTDGRQGSSRVVERPKGLDGVERYKMVAKRIW